MTSFILMLCLFLVSYTDSSQRLRLFWRATRRLKFLWKLKDHVTNFADFTTETYVLILVRVILLFVYHYLPGNFWSLLACCCPPSLFIYVAGISLCTSHQKSSERSKRFLYHNLSSLVLNSIIILEFKMAEGRHFHITMFLIAKEF